MVQFFFLLSVALAYCNSFAQDTSIVKSSYAGSYLVIPKNKHWQINKAFINGGDSYNLKISNSNFKHSYNSGDTIRLPYYVAEMELLNNKSMVLYQLYINQK